MSLCIPPEEALAHKFRNKGKKLCDDSNNEILWVMCVPNESYDQTNKEQRSLRSQQKREN